MVISTHERFENHIDISSPETICDAKKTETFTENSDIENEFDKRISDAESMKEVDLWITIKNHKPNVKEEKNTHRPYQNSIQMNYAHLSLDTIDDKNITLDVKEYTQNRLAEISILNNIKSWIKDINPNFNEFDYESPYCNNCGSCAYAVYQRLEGITNMVATAENIEYNHEMEVLTGMKQVSMSPYEIECRLLSEGSGSHAIIGIDRNEGAGHWFNAVCIDNKIIAIDGQNGTISDWPPDYGDVINWDMSMREETYNG